MSNLESVDLDGDSDLDFLLAHGDTLDDGFAFKPYQGVMWLENRGGGDFAAHRIGTLYGAHRVEAADPAVAPGTAPSGDVLPARVYVVGVSQPTSADARYISELRDVGGPLAEAAALESD